MRVLLLILTILNLSCNSESKNNLNQADKQIPIESVTADATPFEAEDLNSMNSDTIDPVFVNLMNYGDLSQNQFNDLLAKNGYYNSNYTLEQKKLYFNSNMDIIPDWMLDDLLKIKQITAPILRSKADTGADKYKSNNPNDSEGVLGRFDEIEKSIALIKREKRNEYPEDELFEYYIGYYLYDDNDFDRVANEFKRIDNTTFERIMTDSGWTTNKQFFDQYVKDKTSAFVHICYDGKRIKSNDISYRYIDINGKVQTAKIQTIFNIGRPCPPKCP